MSVLDIIKRYESGTHLHVRVRDIRDYLVSGQVAVKDRITFIGSELDVGVLRGFLHQYREAGQYVLLPGNMADIYYDERQPVDWQRLVCCKELLHLLDPDRYQTNTPANVKTLLERIVLPPGMENITTDGIQVWGDRLADLQAIAILFPMGARAALLEAFKSNKITAETIARLARLPERYVRWVMSDQWERLYPTIQQLASVT